MDLTNSKCPFCLIIVDDRKNIVVCSTCKKLHHKECWEYNLNRCTTFTCKGIAIDYELMIVRNTETENTNILMEKKLEEKFLEPVKYKPEKPLPKAKIEKENDNKKIIVKNTKLTDILNNKKNYKNNNNNYSKIEPPEYIPDYVYDSLSDYHKRLKEEKLRMSSIITKNPYKNLKLKNNKENYNKKTNFYPKPPDYIPDYVNEDIETYHKRLQSEKLKSIIFKKMGNFITNNIRKKREEYILPRPDPFIPEFVHRDLKEYVKELIEEKKKKLIKRKIKNSYDNLSNILVNENIISEINIPKPEILLPGYIYSDNKDFDTKFLTSLVKTKKCINCKKDISFRLEVCNFCNYKQIHINKKKLIDYADIINKLIKENDKYDILTDNKNIYINNEEIKRIFLSPSSKYITFINQSNYFKIIDIDTCSIKVILKGHKGKVTSAFFTQDSKYIYTGSTDTLIKKWDVESGKCLNTLQGHEITVDLLEYSYVNQTIISGGGFGVLKVWDLNNNKIKKVINDESKWINTLDYSINNFFFATGNSDSYINILEISNFNLVKSLASHLGQVSCVKYSPNGYFLASCSDDGTIKIWDLENLKCVSSLNAHKGGVNYIDYSPDSKLLVSCGNDKTIKVWNLNNNTCFKILIGHTEVINCVKFSPNGKYILSCSNDKTIKLWKLFSI